MRKQLTAAEITARLGPLGWVCDLPPSARAEVWVNPSHKGDDKWALISRWHDGTVELEGRSETILAAAEALGMCIVIPDEDDLPPVPETVEQDKKERFKRMALTSAVVEAARRLSGGDTMYRIVAGTNPGGYAVLAPDGSSVATGDEVSMSRICRHFNRRLLKPFRLSREDNARLLDLCEQTGLTQQALFEAAMTALLTGRVPLPVREAE